MNPKNFVFAFVAALSILSPAHSSLPEHIPDSAEPFELAALNGATLILLDEECRGVRMKEGYLQELKKGKKLSAEDKARLNFWVGVCYFAEASTMESKDKRRGQKEYRQALDYISTAAKSNHLTAMSNMGYFSFYGKIVDRNYAEAVKWLGQAAAKVHPEEKALQKIKYDLALIYRGQAGVPRDSSKLRTWLMAAASWEYAPALRKLGLLDLEEQKYNDVLKLLNRAADLGDGHAHYLLATYYEEGIVVMRDEAESAKHLCLSGLLRYLPALDRFGKYLEDGPVDKLLLMASTIADPDKFFKKNDHRWAECHDAAFDLYEAAAKLGSAEGNLACGEAYRLARGADKDLIKAFSYYETAAQIGNDEGHFQCGEACRLGRGADKDWKRAIQHYVVSTQKGNTKSLEKLEQLSKLNVAKAIHELGLTYFLGIGIEPDSQKGFELLASLLPKHNPKPLLNPDDLDDLRKRTTFALVGQAYLTGECLEKDPKTAPLIRSGVRVERDPKRAALFLTGAADLGCHESEFELAQLYEKGDGVKQSLKNAIIRYYFLAEGGHAKALEKLERLSDSGAVLAQYMLGVLYTYGKGVEASYERAFKMFSAVLPNILDLDKDRRRKTFTLLGWMYLQGEGVEEDTTTAATFLLKASLFGCDWSRFELAQLFENGDGVMKNTDWAYKLYEHCAAMGDQRAILKIQNLALTRDANLSEPQQGTCVD